MPLGNQIISQEEYPNSRKGLGIDSMGELAVSFELSGQFVNEAGISVPYIHIAHALEQAFNFTFGNVHKEISNDKK